MTDQPIADDETAQCWREDPHQPHMWTWRPEDGGADCPGIPAVTETVHHRQPLGSGLMPCCGRSLAETPGDRQTTNPEQVTCGGAGPTPAGTVDNPDGLREAYAAAIDEGFRTADEIEDANLGECLTDAVLAVRDAELQQLREELADQRAAKQTAAGAADRFRDVLCEALGRGEENPGDDVLVAELRAHFGKTGPEPTAWRDRLVGYEAVRDQINAAATRDR